MTTMNTQLKRFKSLMIQVLAVLTMVLGLAMPTQAVLAIPATAIIYDATSNPLPPNIPSIGFQATQASEFGDYVHLAGTNRILRTVTVTMSAWALHSEYPAMPSAGWDHPITLNIYNAVPGTPLNTRGSLLGTVTQMFTIPWRPVADPTCPNGTAWRAGDNQCYNGFAFNITFDMGSLNLTLPNDIIVGVAYNTQTYGVAPIGVAGPYNSLNVGALGTTTIGTDDNTDNVFYNTSTANWYTDGGVGGVGIFREDTNWTPNGTVNIQITAAPVPSDVYVNLTWASVPLGQDPDGAGPATYIGYDAFTNIQNGINAVASGGTVNVAAGTYTENLPVNKSLTLKGAQTGVAVSGRTAASPTESTITGLTTISADNIVIDGFTLTNPGQTYAVSSSGNRNSLTIVNNIVDTVGSTALGSNVHSILLSDGPDAVTIANNRFNNIKANDKSASAVGVLQSTSTNTSTGLVIEDNVFTNITSQTKGAYGVILNNGAGVPGAQIKNNNFSGLSGGWTHAIGLEGPTPNALVINNQFSSIAATGLDKSAVFFEKNSSGGSVSVAFNQFNGTTFFGVAIHPNDLPGGSNGLSYVVDARNNWWGNGSGPSNGGLGTTDPVTAKPANGSGAVVGSRIRFDPWLGVTTSAVSSGTPTNGGSVALPGNEVVVTNSGTGSPTVIVAKYTGNPSNVGTFVSSGNYYDINVSGTTNGDGSALTISMPGTGSLNYYDGTTWKAVVGVGGLVTASGGVFNFVLNNTSTTPRLYELTGTEFAGFLEQIRISRVNNNPVAAGETFQVVVDAASAKLFGVDVSMTFDTTELDVTNIALGNGLTAGTIAVNTNDNPAGTLRFAYSQLGVSATNVNGVNLVLATITFRAHTAGATSVTMGSVLFTDKDGNPATPGALDSPISLTINPSPSVFVDVALQGRSDHAGMQLEVKPVSTGNVLYDSSVAAGRLEIADVPAGNYTARVSAPKYLATYRPSFNLLASVVAYDLNSPAGTDTGAFVLTLRGGDINADDQINIQDLVMIGVNFGSNTASVDINGDGPVNIQDLAIAAGNYGLKTSVVDASDPAPWQ